MSVFVYFERQGLSSEDPVEWGGIKKRRGMAIAVDRSESAKEQAEEKYDQVMGKLSDDMAVFFRDYIVKARAKRVEETRAKITNKADVKNFDAMIEAGHNYCFARFFRQKRGKCHCECLDPCTCLVHRMRPSKDVVLGQIGSMVPMV